MHTNFGMPNSRKWCKGRYESHTEKFNKCVQLLSDWQSEGRLSPRKRRCSSEVALNQTVSVV
jgi:hypothetical protein